MIKVRCPICDRWMMGASSKEWPDIPFCSPRCRLVDLGRWLGEAYTVRPAPEDKEERSAPAEDEESIP